jgi:hypothetical protein
MCTVLCADAVPQVSGIFRVLSRQPRLHHVNGKADVTLAPLRVEESGEAIKPPKLLPSLHIPPTLPPRGCTALGSFSLFARLPRIALVLPFDQFSWTWCSVEGVILRSQHFPTPIGDSYHIDTMKLLTKDEEAAHYRYVSQIFLT